MKRLKIGVLTEIINYHSGSRAPLEIAKHLSLQNQHVTVYAYSDLLDKQAQEDLKNNGVQIKTIEKQNIPVFSKLIASIQLFFILKKDKPQITTFSGTPPFFVAAKLTGIPVVRIYQGTQFDALLENRVPNSKINLPELLLNKIVNFLIYLIDCMSFRLSNAVVAISKYSKEEGEALYRRKVVKIIYHGSTNILATTNEKKPRNQINIISVSRLTPYKGFHLIIKALKKVHTAKKVNLIIAGSQPKPNYVKYLKRIGGKNLKIYIDPKDTDLAKLYRKSHIYANCDRYLYFGLPICEAALFNLPCISLNFAAAPEIVANKKTGYVAENLDQFASYLEKMINNPNLTFKMGQAARKTATEIFTWEKSAQKYLEVFRKIV